MSRPNNAFKPKPLHSAKHMAGKACHVLRSTTRLGLTQVLGGLDVASHTEATALFDVRGEPAAHRDSYATR